VRNHPGNDPFCYNNSTGYFLLDSSLSSVVAFHFWSIVFVDISNLPHWAFRLYHICVILSSALGNWFPLESLLLLMHCLLLLGELLQFFQCKVCIPLKLLWQGHISNSNYQLVSNHLISQSSIFAILSQTIQVDNVDLNTPSKTLLTPKQLETGRTSISSGTSHLTVEVKQSDSCRRIHSRNSH